MKNLYRIIRVKPDASRSQIRASLNAIRDQLTEDDISDVEYILLDEFRRTRYDNAHRTVQCVTDLRSQNPVASTTGFSKARVHGFIPTKCYPMPHVRSLSGTPNSNSGVDLGGCFGVVVIIAFLIGAVFLLGGGETTKPHSRNNFDSRSTENGRIVESFNQVGENPSSNNSAGNEDPEISKLLEELRQSLAEDFSSKDKTDLMEMPLPETGVMKVFDSNTAVAPLEIRTRRGNGNYYVKISRIFDTGKFLSRTAFIRDGETLTANIPVGDYDIRYAVGDAWYGTQELFGNSTACARADDVFSFRKTTQGYTGFTIELISQIDGNLDTDPLSVEDF